MEDFPTEKPKIKKDRYARARDGASYLMKLSCTNCEAPFAVYQKDGRGRLLRMYADRIAWPPQLAEQMKQVDADNVKEIGNLACGECETVLATPTVYAPENRAAFAVQQGTIATDRMK